MRAALTAYRWVAFAGPRTTTGLGVILLVAIAAPQVSLLGTADYPAWLDAWFVAVGVLTLVAATAVTAARSRLVAGLGWGAGSLVCATSIELWIASRTAGLPGVAGTVGRWDHPGGTAVTGLAAVFLIVHASLLARRHGRGARPPTLARLRVTTVLTLDSPAWLRVEHWLNVLFLTLLIRSGLEILASYPKPYWRDDSRPGTEWARFTRKTMPTDKLYDTLDEEESWSPVISLPGRKMLGMGRHWHVISVLGWVATGVVYVALLFGTGQWHRWRWARSTRPPQSTAAAGSPLTTTISCAHSCAAGSTRA